MTDARGCTFAWLEVFVFRGGVGEGKHLCNLPLSPHEGPHRCVCGVEA